MPAGDLESCYVDSHSSELNPACPQSGGVLLYTGSGFACISAGENDALGYRSRSTSGSQDVADTFNDLATSVRVPDGWSVMLYGGAGQTGETVCVNEDISNLSTLGNFPDTAVAIDNSVFPIHHGVY